MARLIGQADRATLLTHPFAQPYRKRARVIALLMQEEFIVETDRGPMVGHSGDYLVTNHPDDDPGSDLWTISDDRMAATYERTES